jgi:hypothetical protein
MNVRLRNSPDRILNFASALEHSAIEERHKPGLTLSDAAPLHAEAGNMAARAMRRLEGNPLTRLSRARRRTLDLAIRAALRNFTYAADGYICEDHHPNFNPAEASVNAAKATNAAGKFKPKTEIDQMLIGYLERVKRDIAKYG